MRLSLAFRLLALGLGLLLAPPAFAGKKNKKTDPVAEEVNLDDDAAKTEAKDESSEKKEGEEASDEKPKDEEGDKAEGEKEGERPVEPAEDRTSTSPVEHDGETYRFVGARYRLLLIPSAVMGLFGQGGETIFVHDFGPEFTVRRDGFEYSFAITYAPYHMGDGPTSANQIPFKAPDDPEEAWEVVTSNLKILYLTADFLWSHPFSNEVSLIYGGGAGIGFVFGNLYRTQAYKEGGKYLPCPSVPAPPTAPPNQQRYCAVEPDDDPQHEPGYTEPSWANGGSKPIIFPWIALQTGIRYKPHKNFVTRLEVGVGLGQFWVGLGADYGL